MLQAPAVEDLLPLGHEPEEGEGEGREGLGLPSRGDDGQARPRLREDEDDRAREGERDLRLEVARGRRVEKGAAQLLWRRPDAADAVEVEEHRGRAAGLDPRGEVAREEEEGVLGGKGPGRVQAAVHVAIRLTRDSSSHIQDEAPQQNDSALAASQAKAVSATSAERRTWRPALTRAPRPASSRPGPGGVDHFGPVRARARAAPPGPTAT